MEKEFKFGDRVKHKENAVIYIGQHEDDFWNRPGSLWAKVMTDRGLTYSAPINELKPASDWMEIDWDDSNTLPPSGKKVLVLVGERIEVDSYKCPFAFYQYGFEINGCDATHWRTMPNQPRGN